MIDILFKQCYEVEHFIANAWFKLREHLLDFNESSSFVQLL